MITNDFLIFGLFSLILNCLLLYFIIQWATRSNSISKDIWIQKKVLEEIARKQGVEEEKLQEIYRKAG